MSTPMAYLAVVLMGAIGVISVIVAGFGFYLMGMAAIDKLHGWRARRRFNRARPMATDCSIDELQLRRLKRSVAVRIAQRKAAN